MTEGAVAPGWYPDPNDPAHLRYWDGYRWGDVLPVQKPTNTTEVFFKGFLWGFLLPLIVGILSGTAGLPIFGTLFGGFVGGCVGLVTGALIGTVLAVAARPGTATTVYRVTLDVLLGVVAVATVVGAVLLILDEGGAEGVGERTGAAVIVLTVIGLVIARGRLRKLAPA